MSLFVGVKEEIEVFIQEDDKLYYIIIVFKDKEVSLIDVKVKVLDYNEKYYKFDCIWIFNIYLGIIVDDCIFIFVLCCFKDKQDVMKYYNGVQCNKSEFVDGGVEFEFFFVIQNNYCEIFKQCKIDGYWLFFQQYYFNQCVSLILIFGLFWFLYIDQELGFF